MNITVIFGTMALVGAVAALCWGLAAGPSRARATSSPASPNRPRLPVPATRSCTGSVPRPAG